MKDKQLVIATLLLLVTLHTIPGTFALSPLARFIDIIKVPELEKRLENIILRMHGRSNPNGVLDNLNGDDTGLGNSPAIPGLTSFSSANSILGKENDPELSTIEQVTGGRLRSGLFSHLFKG
ncbi:uncharacterized protein LOC143371215 [Andrena cerasifolii]|uniref:uncharacterized protein LOC143371215 n=1 Tax=Andrena cerasifolii TaxID=2819439 RepID=UPI0040380508